jgi:hypothetical protein
MYAPKKITN